MYLLDMLLLYFFLGSGHHLVLCLYITPLLPDLANLHVATLCSRHVLCPAGACSVAEADTAAICTRSRKGQVQQV